MNQQKDLHAIGDQLSKSHKKIIYLSVLGELMVTLHILTAHTRKMLGLRMFRQVHSCMDLANRIYESGNEPQKNAVERIYIESFPALKTSCSKTDWNLVKVMMPESLYKAYLEQLVYTL